MVYLITDYSGFDKSAMLYNTLITKYPHDELCDGCQITIALLSVMQARYSSCTGVYDDQCALVPVRPVTSVPFCTNLEFVSAYI